MTNEQLRMQMLSGVITESEYKAKLEELNPSTEKDSLNENFIGMGAINNPFADRTKETYEDAFEHFLSQKYDLKENEDGMPEAPSHEETDAAQVYEEETKVNEDEDKLKEGEEPLKDIPDEEKAEYLVYMTGMSYEDALIAVRRGLKSKTK
jgi:hypothetical protein